MNTPLPNLQHLTFSIANRTAYVTLNRPEVHNAFNARLIDELRDVFEYIAARDRRDVRAAVLAGNGRSFCAGADVEWMRAGLELTEAENVQDTLRMARMFDTIDRCPVPVIARVHGAALGGGVGLAAVSDIVLAVDGTVWGLSEVRLGIAPAAISPYVLAKIGRSQARALFLTGDRFDSHKAVQIGLAHKVVSAEAVDGEVKRAVESIMLSSPWGIERAKELIAVVPDLSHDDAMQLTADTIAALRVTPAAQEGLRAFLEKRKPEWAG